MSVTPWQLPCRHCGHPMSVHALDWATETDSDCYELGCQCPGFETNEE